MRIADNRNTISWVNADRKQTPKDNSDKISPNIDWFVSSLLANYRQYNLDASSKSQLIYFVYLLLNDEFQSFLVRLRALFDIPQDGFEKIDDFRTWEKNFNQSANEFSKREYNDRFGKILKYYESKTGKRTKSFKLDYMQEEPTEEIVHALLQDFSISHQFYFPWLLFMKSILFKPDPKHFLDGLARNAQEEGLEVENNTITITITRKSTINSLRETLNNNKDIVNQAIQDIKNRVKETELEVEFLERDYSAYKIYTNYSAKDNKYSRDRKVDKVNMKMKLKSKKYTGEVFNDGSIRKIASRMSKRIETTFSNRQRVFESVLDNIEQFS